MTGLDGRPTRSHPFADRLGRRWIDILIGRAPVLYLIIGACSALFFCFALPPLQAPDAGAHLLRAYQISTGNMVGIRPDPDRAGGEVDVALYRLLPPFYELIGRADRKATAERFRQAAGLQWSNQRFFAELSNTVRYGPLLYLPQAAGLLLGRMAGLSILHSYYLACLLNAAAIVAIGYAALKVARQGRAFLLLVLLTPMTVGLVPTPSQDGLLIATSVLLAALLASAAGPDRKLTLPAYAGTIVALVAAVQGRPTHACLVALLLTRPLRGFTWHGRNHSGWPPIVGAIIVLGAALAWTRVIAGLLVAQIHPGETLDPQAQLGFILEHPLAWLKIAAHTFWLDAGTLWRSMVGVLGWLDTVLPSWVYALAAVAYPLVLVSEAPAAARLRPLDRLVLGLALLGMAVGTLASQFITWTPPGEPVIQGLQGRYFLPLMPFLPMLLPPLPAPLCRRLRVLGALAPPAATLGLIGAGIAVIARYWP